jgi:CD109 antigen
MIGVAPNAALLAYLAARPGVVDGGTQLRSRALANAALGWQRELTFRHSDGSFSAFGASDGDGSTWLTAFVLRVFSELAVHEGSTVDGAVLASAADWLLQRMQPDGSFEDRGRVIHSEMQGGSGAASLSSFVLASLLSAPADTVPPSRLDPALDYITKTEGDAPYPRVLRAHALSLACRRGQPRACAAAGPALDQLLSAADAPWLAPSDGIVAAPEKVELAGYTTLALLAAGRSADAAAPSRWLALQRSGGGGFSSTQDTVVGLAALSAFAAAVGRASVDLKVSVWAAAAGSSAETQLAVLALNESNAAVLQRLDMPTDGTLRVSVAGSGSALLSLTTRYNSLPLLYSSQDFLLASSALNISGSASRRALLAAGPPAVMHHRTCFGRPAGRSEGGMLLLQIGLFSGYSPVQASLDAAQEASNGLIRRIDTADRRVDVYLDSLAPGAPPLCLSFDAVRHTAVQDLAPASTRLFDYYRPTVQSAVSLDASDVGAAEARPPAGVAPAPADAFSAAPRGRAGGAGRWGAKASKQSVSGRRRTLRRLKPLVLAVCAAAAAALLCPASCGSALQAAREAGLRQLARGRRSD